jgi:hypothetical protein
LEIPLAAAGSLTQSITGVCQTRLYRSFLGNFRLGSPFLDILRQLNDRLSEQLFRLTKLSANFNGSDNQQPSKRDIGI